MQLWKPGSPMVCHLPAGDRGEPVVSFQSKSTGLRTRSTSGIIPSSRAGDQGPSSSSQAEGEFFLPHLFVLSLPSRGCVVSAHLHWEGQSLLSLWIQMLSSSRNTLTDMPENTASLNIWTPHEPVKWTPKINHHHTLAKTDVETRSEKLPCKSFVSRWKGQQWLCDPDSGNHSGAQGSPNGSYRLNDAQPEGNGAEKVLSLRSRAGHRCTHVLNPPRQRPEDEKLVDVCSRFRAFLKKKHSH